MVFRVMEFWTADDVNRPTNNPCHERRRRFIDFETMFEGDSRIAQNEDGNHQDVHGARV